MPDYEFLGPGDKAALLGLSSPDYMVATRAALIELGYKVHYTDTHEEFVGRFGQVQYEVAVIEECFGGVLPENNVALTTLQNMPMIRRRHVTIILFGDFFETLNAMQAFGQSAHGVINRGDIDKLKIVLQQTISESAMFLNVFKDVQGRIDQGKR